VRQLRPSRVAFGSLGSEIAEIFSKVVKYVGTVEVNSHDDWLGLIAIGPDDEDIDGH
jgi:hypothetical protein